MHFSTWFSKITPEDKNNLEQELGVVFATVMPREGYVRSLKARLIKEQIQVTPARLPHKNNLPAYLLLGAVSVVSGVVMVLTGLRTASHLIASWQQKRQTRIPPKAQPAG